MEKEKRVVRRTRMGEDETSLAKKCDDRIKSLRLEIMLNPSKAIHRICRSGNLRSLLALLAEYASKKHEIVNERNSGGAIPLHFAGASSVRAPSLSLSPHTHTHTHTHSQPHMDI